jgi:hypothetical protein
MITYIGILKCFKRIGLIVFQDLAMAFIRCGLCFSRNWNWFLTVRTDWSFNGFGGGFPKIGVSVFQGFGGGFPKVRSVSFKGFGGGFPSPYQCLSRDLVVVFLRSGQCLSRDLVVF